MKVCRTCKKEMKKCKCSFSRRDIVESSSVSSFDLINWGILNDSFNSFNNSSSDYSSSSSYSSDSSSFDGGGGGDFGGGGASGDL